MYLAFFLLLLMSAPTQAEEAPAPCTPQQLELVQLKQQHEQVLQQLLALQHSLSKERAATAKAEEERLQKNGLQPATSGAAPAPETPPVETNE